MIKLGTAGIGKTYLGDSGIEKAYIGDVLVFDAGGVEPQPTVFTWGNNTSTSTAALGQYAWPVFKPLDVVCHISKIYFNQPYATGLTSNTSFVCYIAELNEEKTKYTITSSKSYTLTAGEVSVDVDIDLPANSSIYIKMNSNQQQWMRVESTLSDANAYPQAYANNSLIGVNKTYTANSSYSKRAWSVKLEYTL